MKKFLIWSLVNALLLTANYFSSVSASPPGPYEPAIEEYKKAKAEAEKKAKEQSGEKAKPSEVRDSAPKAGSEKRRLTGPKRIRMYKWKDAKGQWHFSDAPPPGVKAQLLGGIEELRSAKLSSGLGQSFVGIALGQTLKSFLAAKKGAERGRDGRGLRLFRMAKSLWPPGAEALEVGFSKNSLVSIEVKYGASYLQTIGGWDGLVRETTESYGTPAKADIQKALWRHGKNGLLLNRGGNGAVTATFGTLKSAFTLQDLK